MSVSISPNDPSIRQAGDAACPLAKHSRDSLDAMPEVRRGKVMKPQPRELGGNERVIGDVNLGHGCCAARMGG